MVGTYVALSKPLAAALPVLLLAWLRFGIGALAMLHWLPKPADEPRLTTRTHLLLFLESLLGNFLFTLCMIYGVSLTNAISAGVVMSAIPAAVALMGWFFFRETINRQTFFAIAMAVSGIALFAAAAEKKSAMSSIDEGQLLGVPVAWIGYGLLLGAVVCEAAYSVIGKQLTKSLDPKRITALINLWGLVLSTPLGIYTAWGFDFGSVDWNMWLLLVFYALAACVWTVWLWMTGLRAVPAAQGGIFTVMLPISAALVGILVLGESLSALQVTAFGMALASVVLATWPKRSE